ncbi:hypothetical protein [Pedobacter sp. Leaf194]|uniref:hypothetical protein n=1 Tax=Pedobacter sp. Leaf194 TaxID=1736297 RepID=UPI000AC35E5E|nr:hypothetical protein [Pedobacter sp. Leaf194]
MINSAYLSPLVKAFFHPGVSGHMGILKTSHDYLPAATVNLFFAHAADELLCLCHFYPEWIRINGQSAFATIGCEKSRDRFNEIRTTFPNAKIYTVFANDLTGKVWDCQLSLWQCGLEADFMIRGTQLEVILGAKKLSIPSESFSLNRFFKCIGKFQTSPALKPRGGYRNFTEKFCARYPC